MRPRTIFFGVCAALALAGGGMPTVAQPCLTAPCETYETLVVDVATGGTYDPESLRPPHYFGPSEIRVVGPNEITSSCFGEFETPVCALDTSMACHLDHFDQLCSELAWGGVHTVEGAISREYVIAGGRVLTPRRMERTFLWLPVKNYDNATVIIFDVWIRECKVAQGCETDSWWRRYGIDIATGIVWDRPPGSPGNRRSSRIGISNDDIAEIVDRFGQVHHRPLTWAFFGYFPITKLPEPGDEDKEPEEPK